MSVERNDAPHLSADEVAQPTSEMLNTDYAEDGMTQDPGCSNSLSVDEIVSWLHYPLDDAFEKSYCSDLFGHWPPSGTQLYKDPSVPESIHPGPVSMGMGQADSSEFLVGNAANCSSTLNVGSSSLGRSVSAEKALALGAGRAAGLIAPAGVEAFNKVRTTLQPRVPKLGSPSFSLPKNAGSFQAACSSASLDVSGGSSAPTASAMLPPRIHCQGSNANRFSLQPNGGKPKTFVRPSALPPAHAAGKCIADEGTSSKQRGGGANSSTYSSLAESSTTVLRKELDTSINCSKAPDTGGGLLPQQAMLVPKREMEQATSGSSAVDTGSTQVNMDTFGKVIQRRTVVEGREKRLGVREAPEMVRTFSGGSQTSADRSTKEATSSGKRILEDSECYSEDAEGESAETKHPQSRSTSKRSRAAEIHNQSERRRRDRINEKMKALQKLIPNSNKTDKASMLDEAIEYLKMLQLQLQMMSMRTGLSPVMIPTGVPHMQIPQMAPMHHLMGMGMTVGPPGMGMGMGLSMGMGAIDMQHAVTGHPLLTLPSHPASFYPPGISSTATATVTDSQIQASSATESSPIYFPHPHFHLAHQSLQSVNMDMYNAYLQQQPQQHQSQYANYSISNSKDGSSS